MTPSDPPHRTLLARAIEDIQGSIHANDSKSAAGLVVHGLLATAVLTLAVHLGPVYRTATVAGHEFIKWSLIATLPAGVASIFCLIVAVYPHGPGKIDDRLEDNHLGVFFPDVKKLKSSRSNELDQLRTKLTKLADAADPNALDDEYLAELLKVAYIRFKEAWWAKAGFILLAVEVLCVAIFLATVGCITDHVLFAATSTTSNGETGGVSLHWDIIQGRHRYSLASGGNQALPGQGVAQVRLLAKDPHGLQRVQVVEQVSFRCAEHGEARTHSTRPVTRQDVRLFAAKQALLVTSSNFHPGGCPGGGRFIGVVVRLTADAHSESAALASSSLVLRARR